MTYRSAIEYLFGLQKHGMKFGLDNITRLLHALGDPQDSFRAVHIAGTNGKGSTAAMIEAMLRSADVVTGLFTSPHLVSFTERIRVNGAEITEEEVITLADEVRKAAEPLTGISPTFFEVVTAMAFRHFQEKRVDWAVVEVGLGGRLDATNVIRPDVAVINRIGLDHCEFLGERLADVASEKAGIIKEGIPVVTAEQSPEAAEVIVKRASEKSARLFRYGMDFSADLVSEEPDGIVIDYHGDSDLTGLRVPLGGAYQVVNASLALKTVEIISARYPGLGSNVSGGLRGLRWPGRLELIRHDPAVLIDGAHNTPAAAALADYLRMVLRVRYRRLILVLGIMADKDIDGILSVLLPLASEVVCCAAAYGRAAEPEYLASRAAALGYRVRTSTTVSAAVETALDLRLPGDLIMVTGSFYTIGEAKEYFGGAGVLSRLRES